MHRAQRSRGRATVDIGAELNRDSLGRMPAKKWTHEEIAAVEIHRAEDLQRESLFCAQVSDTQRGRRPNAILVVEDERIRSGNALHRTGHRHAVVELEAERAAIDLADAHAHQGGPPPREFVPPSHKPGDSLYHTDAGEAICTLLFVTGRCENGPRRTWECRHLPARK